jgi:hypothetical protein
MNSAGNNKKTGYLVIALLLVGLTAYSNAVKELTEVQRLTQGASELIAQWSNEAVPAEIPQIPQTVIKLDTCESKQLASVAAVPLVPEVPDTIELNMPAPEKANKTKRPTRVKPSTDQLVEVKKATRFEFGAADFAFQISTDRLPEPSEPIVVELPASAFKVKARKHNFFKFNPRDREMLLKTLNRNLNLRTAG